MDYGPQTEGDRMRLALKPWMAKEKRYTNPRLKKSAPPEIVELYKKYKAWCEEQYQNLPSYQKY